MPSEKEIEEAIETCAICEYGEILRDAYLSMKSERDTAINLGKAIGNAMDEMKSERDKYRAIVEDFANHGTRHDLNPTMHFTGDEMEMAKWCIGYMKSMDNYVRNIAKEALSLREKES